LSLIVEALKRARDDAVRRQAATKGLPLAPVPRLQGRSRWLTFALVPLAAALVICVLLLFDLYSKLPTRPSSTEASVGTQPLPSVAAAAKESDPTKGAELSPAPGSQPAAESSVPVPQQSPINMSTVGTTQNEGMAAASDGSAVTTEPREPPPTTTESVPVERAAAGVSSTDRVFVGQAVLSNGQLIDLGGIAWSESEPYALLNGQVVGVGELIRTYRITEITQEEVILEQDDDRIVLRLN